MKDQSDDSKADSEPDEQDGEPPEGRRPAARLTNPELQAMSRIDKILGDLVGNRRGAVRRVLNWVAGQHGLAVVWDATASPCEAEPSALIPPNM